MEPTILNTLGWGCPVSINSSTILFLGYEKRHTAYLHLFESKWIMSGSKSSIAPVQIDRAICTVGFDKNYVQ